MSTSALFPFISFHVLVLVLAGCTSTGQMYSTLDQYDLAKIRVESMKGQLGLSFTLEKENIHSDEEVFFMAHFVNKTNTPIMLRVPQQVGVLDIDHPNMTLLYSITPLNKSISLETPLSILSSTPYIFTIPVQSSEFELLESHSTKDVKLEIPNVVYLKQGDQWKDSVIPAGKYLIDITYENMYIGYEVEEEGEIYFKDVLAWVGKIDAKPVLLTIFP